MPSVISGDANVSATEFGYLDGVTSAIQTQINGVKPTWADWTPTLSGITTGNGTLISRYALLNKVCIFRFWFKLGSTSAISSGAGFTLPFAVNQTADSQLVSFLAMYHDSGTSVFYGRGDVGYLSSNNTTVEFGVSNASGTYVNSSQITNTVPMTWTTNDKLFCSGTYEVA